MRAKDGLGDDQDQHIALGDLVLGHVCSIGHEVIGSGDWGARARGMFVTLGFGYFWPEEAWGVGDQNNSVGLWRRTMLG